MCFCTCCSFTLTCGKGWKETDLFITGPPSTSDPSATAQKSSLPSNATTTGIIRPPPSLLLCLPLFANDTSVSIILRRRRGGGGLQIVLTENVGRQVIEAVATSRLGCGGHSDLCGQVCPILPDLVRFGFLQHRVLGPIQPGSRLHSISHLQQITYKVKTVSIVTSYLPGKGW